MQPTFSFRSVILAASLCMLAACGTPPENSAYLNRGTPESLLDVSSEVVSLNAASSKDLAELSDWIEKDQPTRAELNCTTADKYCNDARNLLELHGVSAAVSGQNGQTVTLVYERILARDCDQHFRDNHSNAYNRSHPAFGCSIAANMVQQVTNKQEFINPNIADDPSAKRSVNDMQRAYVPRAVVEPYSVGESQVSKAKSD